MDNNKKIAVIGAGINGLSCAYLIKKTLPDLDVDIYAEKFSPETTSNVAAGLWRAANVGNTPREKLNRWSKASIDFAVEMLSNDPDAADKGFSFQHGYLLSRKPINTTWRHLAMNPLLLDEESLRKRFPCVDKDIKYGLSYTSISLQPTKFLPYLMKDFQNAGGKLVQKSLHKLSDLSISYDIIINCSGLGARELVNDDKVFPVRGQILYVEAPWINEFVYDIDIKDGNVPYIIPNIDKVIIGGTKQINNDNLEPVEKDRKWILENTQKLIPSLKNAKIIREVVGLRPGRNEVRLESEKIAVKVEGKPDKIYTVIHNYGHGANGITLSWGCAVNVVELLKECLKEISSRKYLKSKM